MAIDFTARTVSEIEAAMVADKESRSALNGLTSSSDASIWLNIIRTIAATVNLHENAFLGFADEIEIRAAQIPVGTVRWYAYQSLFFQLGDALEVVNGKVAYSVIDEDKQIIKLAAADKENGFLILKAAKLNASGVAIPLSGAELTAFQQYWSEKKFACVPISFISQTPDTARITYRIGVDASVIDPATGESLANPGTYPVEDAINAYLQAYQIDTDRFNSLFRIVELTDQIQKVSGVKNPIPEDVQIMPLGGTFTDVLLNNNKEYLARAGYIAHDTTPSFTLRDLLQYYDA